MHARCCLCQCASLNSASLTRERTYTLVQQHADGLYVYLQCFELRIALGRVFRLDVETSLPLNTQHILQHLFFHILAPKKELNQVLDLHTDGPQLYCRGYIQKQSNNYMHDVL
jgi:hypothetical protein